jgi:hypothetical protein
MPVEELLAGGQQLLRLGAAALACRPHAFHVGLSSLRMPPQVFQLHCLVDVCNHQQAGGR